LRVCFSIVGEPVLALLLCNTSITALGCSSELAGKFRPETVQAPPTRLVPDTRDGVWEKPSKEWPAEKKELQLCMLFCQLGHSAASKATF
jgi:hypothetical protein